MARGGYREKSGRKSKVDELKVQNLAVKSIESKYGSVEKGFKSLLETGEPSLIKFVWEHAVGKPREKVDMNMEGNMNQFHDFSNEELTGILRDIYNKLSGPAQASNPGDTSGAGASQA